jgi:transcriptional regulator with XRE-family HTH domain
MSIDEFLLLSGRDIARITQSDEAVWSRYFRGRQSIGEKSLVRHAKALDLTPSQLLEGITKRRESKVLAKRD